jgi:MFS family permease
MAWPGFWVNLGVTGNMFAFVGLWGDRLLHDVHGLSLDEGANYYTLSLIGFAVGCLIMGSVSDTYGKRKPFIMGAAFVSLLAWLALLYAPWQPGLSAYLLYGFLGFAASGFVLGYSVAKEVSEPAHAGMAIGLVNTGLFLGAAIMQPLFGWVLDQTWNGAMQGELRIYQVSDYENALLVSAGLALMAFLVSFKIKETQCKNITHD